MNKKQYQLMKKFYSLRPMKIIYNKQERKEIWDQIKLKDLSNLQKIKSECESLYNEIEKSIDENRNLQSAIFSECVYAFTLSKLFNLSDFYLNDSCLTPEHKGFLKTRNIFARYIYTNRNRNQFLIQAGSCKNVDCFFIDGKEVYRIEFKEPYAKTTEPDLPWYGEDGKIPISDIKKFLNDYPQFELMLDNHKDTNFFDKAGSNINDFTYDEIVYAVINNYINKEHKTADVICTEDKNKNLILLPVDDINNWADLEGEIRPAGRNNYNVQTKNKLNDVLREIDAEILNTIVKVNKDALKPRIQRGGKKISGYKISPLFYIRVEDCKEIDNKIIFSIDKVRQLKPTITAKIKLDQKKSSHKSIKDYYGF